MTKANIHYAKTHLSKLIEQALAGEEVVICKAGKELVRLAPVADEPKVDLRASVGSYKGIGWIAPDFDAPDPEIERWFYEGDPLPGGVAEE